MIERNRTTTGRVPTRRVPGCRASPSRTTAFHRAAGAALLAALLWPLASARALAEPDPEVLEDQAPVLETLGERHRVREGRIGEPEAFDADAALAAGGTVSGKTPLLEALPRWRLDTYGETWIADVGLLLPGTLDRDDDGFFSGFELTLDVDTELSSLDVYAVVELTDSAGFVTLAHDTADFRVHGYSSADRYRVEVELLQGHDAGYRDLRIEVRDARDGQLLDQVSAHEFRNLAALPLESERGGFADDDPYHADGRPVDHGDGAFVAGYAAANGPLGALALLALALWRRRRSRIAHVLARRARA